MYSGTAHWAAVCGQRHCIRKYYHAGCRPHLPAEAGHWPFSDKVTIVRNNFSHIADVCEELGVDKIDGILLDLGVSSYQLDTAERGFSYNADAPLDMRMDERASLNAEIVVNTYSAQELTRILFEYFTGASTGDSADGALIRAKAIRYRAPYTTT